MDCSEKSEYPGRKKREKRAENANNGENRQNKESRTFGNRVKTQTKETEKHEKKVLTKRKS